MRLSSYDIECIKKAKNFIDSDMSRHHTIAEIASHTGISPTKLKKDFKELFGSGLYHYLKETRMDKALYLIEQTEKPLKQISRMLGYRHLTSFITAFKKKYGNPPFHWRNDPLPVVILLQILQYLFPF
jgi:AraC family transcriptional activator of pyochelin receptor